MFVRGYIHSAVWTYRHISGKLDVPELEFIGPFLSPDSVCLDVGANGGSWTRGLARLASHGHVFAFEALPYYANVLSNTMKLLRVRNVTILNRAVAENDGVVRMIDRDSSGKWLIGKVHVATEREVVHGNVSVPSVSLDSFWREIAEKRVDFVKCDIEGFELYALRGATRLVERCRPLFYNELNREWCERYNYLPQDVFDFFKRWGYSAYYIDLGKGLTAVDMPTHVNRDVLFVPDNRRIPAGFACDSTRQL